MGEYSKLKKQTERIVKAAAKFARNVHFTVSEKGDVANVVTTADLNVQRYLKKKLKELLPQAGFYCEEENLRENTESEYVWVIDPIDGTMNYTRGIPQCAISVGLIRNNEAVVGVVHNPFQKDTFSAALGDGATKNGKPIHVSSYTFERSLLFTAMSVYKKDLAPICNEIISEAYSQCSDVRRFGTCALELCYIAEGAADLFFEIRVFPWDYAGAYLVLKEAGGVLKGFNGETLAFDKPTPLVGANSVENYEKLNRIVMRHMKKIPY